MGKIQDEISFFWNTTILRSHHFFVNMQTDFGCNHGKPQYVDSPTDLGKLFGILSSTIYPDMGVEPKLGDFTPKMDGL